MEEYRIFRFQANSVNGLEVVELTFDEKLNLFVGKNGAGKTSIINSIMQTFSGGLSLKKGAENGHTTVDIGTTDPNGNRVGYRIKRILGNGKVPRLEVYTGENFDLTIRKPSEFLKTMVGVDVAISPTMFINVKGGGKARKQILAEAIGLDTEEQDQTIVGLKFQRTALKTKIDKTRNELKLDPINPNLRAEETSINDLVAQLNKANLHNQSIEKKQSGLESNEKNYLNDVEDLKKDLTEIEALEARLKQMKETYRRKKEQVEDFKKQLEQEKQELRKLEPIDTAPIQGQIADLDRDNRAIRINNEKKLKLVKMENSQEEYHRLGQEIKQVEAEKQANIADLMPIPGITIGEDDVYYDTGNGIPVPASKWSTSEAIYIGCAVRVAQGNKSPLKTVFVDDVSLLDVETLTKMRELLGEFQIFEVHNTIIGDPVNVITISEGKVKNG